MKINVSLVFTGHLLGPDWGRAERGQSFPPYAYPRPEPEPEPELMESVLSHLTYVSMP